MKDEERWVSCARDVQAQVAEHRHILPRGDTTLCGSTGAGEGVWRGNTTKTKCPRCVEVKESK